MLRLKEKYYKEAMPKIKEAFGYKNNLAVPRIEKVVVNTGIGRFQDEQQIKESIFNDIALICGQRPVYKKAKHAISAFKIREGSIVGIAVTLRGAKMYDFLDRLINVALPRSRDFRGISNKGIDQYGNLSIGLKEQIIFPEISAESAKKIFSLQVCVKTNAKNKQQAFELFKLLGFPFSKN
jgi:large subunit ribosomal protein L5